jgi:hypothetical protein
MEVHEPFDSYVVSEAERRKASMKMMKLGQSGLIVTISISACATVSATATTTTSSA